MRTAVIWTAVSLGTVLVVTFFYGLGWHSGVMDWAAFWTGLSTFGGVMAMLWQSEMV